MCMRQLTMITVPLQLVQEAQLTSEATSEWTPVQELEILRHWLKKEGCFGP